MEIEKRLEQRGLELPPALLSPDGAVRFAWARAYGDRVFISAQGPLRADATLIGPFGRVGAEVTLEQARELARLTTLSLLASLKREIGDLDRVAAWLRVTGYVLTAPDFDRTPLVLNGCSDLLLDLFGPEIGRHARTAVGVAATPFSCPVLIQAEVAIKA